MTVLHLCVLFSATEPFYRFVNDHFQDQNANHLFFIKESQSFFTRPKGKNVRLHTDFNLVSRFLWMVWALNRADKIFLHGIWDYKSVILLCAQPWLFRKCYWVIWGGDLYAHRFRNTDIKSKMMEKIRQFSIRRIGHLVTHIHGDFKLAQEWYGANGHWHECFMYPSNLYNAIKSAPSVSRDVQILLGNSADPRNNHIAALTELLQVVDRPVKIYCPLSYGDAVYAQKVINCGKSLFGTRFIPITDFLSLDEYNKLLSRMDLAVFFHDRQQGMGNITTLLGMGKKVFISPTITSWDTLSRLGVKIFDISHLDLNKIDPNTAQKNQQVIQSYFSETTLKHQLSSLFNESGDKKKCKPT